MTALPPPPSRTMSWTKEEPEQVPAKPRPVVPQFKIWNPAASSGKVLTPTPIPEEKPAEANESKWQKPGGVGDEDAELPRPPSLGQQQWHAQANTISHSNAKAYGDAGAGGSVVSGGGYDEHDNASHEHGNTHVGVYNGSDNYGGDQYHGGLQGPHQGSVEYDVHQGGENDRQQRGYSGSGAQSNSDYHVDHVHIQETYTSQQQQDYAHIPHDAYAAGGGAYNTDDGQGGQYHVGPQGEYNDYAHNTQQYNEGEYHADIDINGQYIAHGGGANVDIQYMQHDQYEGQGEGMYTANPAHYMQEGGERLGNMYDDLSADTQREERDMSNSHRKKMPSDYVIGESYSDFTHIGGGVDHPQGGIDHVQQTHAPHVVESHYVEPQHAHRSRTSSHASYISGGGGSHGYMQHPAQSENLHQHSHPVASSTEIAFEVDVVAQDGQHTLQHRNIQYHQQSYETEHVAEHDNAHTQYLEEPPAVHAHVNAHDSSKRPPIRPKHYIEVDDPAADVHAHGEQSQNVPHTVHSVGHTSVRHHHGHHRGVSNSSLDPWVQQSPKPQRKGGEGAQQWGADLHEAENLGPCETCGPKWKVAIGQLLTLMKMLNADINQARLKDSERSTAAFNDLRACHAKAQQATKAENLTLRQQLHAALQENDALRKEREERQHQALHDRESMYQQMASQEEEDKVASTLELIEEQAKEIKAWKEQVLQYEVIVEDLNNQIKEHKSQIELFADTALYEGMPVDQMSA